MIQMGVITKTMLKCRNHPIKNNYKSGFYSFFLSSNISKNVDGKFFFKKNLISPFDSLNFSNSFSFYQFYIQKLNIGRENVFAQHINYACSCEIKMNFHGCENFSNFSYYLD